MTLSAIYLVLALAGAIFVAALLDPIKLDQETSDKDRKINPELLIETVKHLISSPYQMLLIPLTMYSGVEQAFIGGDFTQVNISLTLSLSAFPIFFAR